MSEKPPHRPLLADDHNDNFAHPTAPPSYDEAMIGNQSLNQPVNPYLGHPSQPIPYPAVTHPVPHGVPVYPQQLVNVPHASPQVPAVNVAFPVAQVVPVGPKGVRMRCCHCGADIKSSTVSSNKASAHIACMLLCIFTCCLCSWIPYCMSSCKKIDHKCPNCKGYLGTYNA